MFLPARCPTRLTREVERDANPKQELETNVYSLLGVNLTHQQAVEPQETRFRYNLLICGINAAAYSLIGVTAAYFFIPSLSIPFELVAVLSGAVGFVHNFIIIHKR